MASNHRMFSNSITQSARFLRMPLTTQALYFHLGMQADDDGVVEAFTVLRLSGASEDDLKLLAAKGFVKVLNEDLVTVIIDWRVNNTIKKDRYQPSVYAHMIQSGTRAEPERNQSGTNPEPQDKTRQDNIRQDNIRQDNTTTTTTTTTDNASPSWPQVERDELVIYAQANLSRLNVNALTELIGYRDKLPDELIRYAIDETLANDTSAYSYCKAILNRLVEQGIKTVGEARAADAERKKRKAGGGKQAKPMIQRDVREDEFGDGFGDGFYSDIMSRPRGSAASG